MTLNIQQTCSWGWSLCSEAAPFFKYKISSWDLTVLLSASSLEGAGFVPFLENLMFPGIESSILGVLLLPFLPSSLFLSLPFFLSCVTELSLNCQPPKKDTETSY